MKLTKNRLKELIRQSMDELTEADVMDKKLKYKDKEGNEKEATVGGIIKQGEDHPAYKKAKALTDKGKGEEKPKTKATKISADPFAKDDKEEKPSGDDEPFDSGGPAYPNVPKGAKTSKQAKAMKAKAKEKPSKGKTDKFGLPVKHDKFGNTTGDEKSKDEKKAKHDDLLKQGLNAGGSADYNKVHDVVKSMKSEEEKDEYLGYLKKEHKRREVVSKKVEKKLDIISAKIDKLEYTANDRQLTQQERSTLEELEEQKSKLWEYQEENDPDVIESTMDSVDRQSETRDQQRQWELNKSTQSHPEEIRAVTGTPPFQLGRDDHDVILTKVDKAVEHAKKNGADEATLSRIKDSRDELEYALKQHKARSEKSGHSWEGTYPIQNPEVTNYLGFIQKKLLGTDNPDYDATEEEDYYDEGKTRPMPWNQKKEESITSKLKREFKEYDLYNKTMRKL